MTRKIVFIAFAVAAATLSAEAGAACDLTIQVSSTNPPTPADGVTWNGCGASGTSVQSALDRIQLSGGGSLKLSGPGTLLVKQPLRVYNGTQLYGDPARTPYGMKLIGENALSNCSIGGGFRHPHCPVIKIENQLSTSSANNVVIWNLHIDGNSPGKPLSAPGVQISNSNNVLITYNRISGARTFGVAISDSDNTRVAYLTLEMVRKSGSEPEGGSGVWIKQSDATVLEHSLITGPGWYAAGIPQGDYRAGPNAAPTMDLVAVYGSAGNTIRHNTITHGNTAAIYLAACEDPQVCSPVGYNAARVSSATIWNNDISYFRQHGIDVANTDQSYFFTNRVSNSGDSALAMGDAHYNEVRFNTFNGVGQSGGTQDGALKFLWASSNNLVSNNDIYGAGSDYAVGFATGAAPPYAGSPTANTVSGNNLWAGSLGYIGGATAGNVVSPNNQY